MFKTPSFEDAVRLFKEWGFQVEPGPRPGEVTLVVNGGDFRNYSVYRAEMLPQIAAVALKVRWENGLMAPPERAAGRPAARPLTLPAGAASLLRH